MQAMNSPLPPLIQALLEPARHGGAVQQVELVQTHISWVLLAGDFAYKIKKPLKLSFLDFSTLALRRICCEDEMRLNRRFSPDLYLEVVGIFNTPLNPQWEGTGPAIEYAVKMRRFDDAARLDRVCARGELRPADLSDLADTLVAFHTSAAAPLPDAFCGSADSVIGPARENFQDLRTLLAPAGLKSRLDTLQGWTEAQFGYLTALMAARRQAGHIRECHGDLHLANMVMIDRRVRLFDCIEFNPALRWIDVASEIAFTYVDLLAHGQPGLANWFINAVLSRSGDYEAALVLRFYAVYRALVRAKVAALRIPAGQDDSGEALAYIALAEQLLAPPAARLLITHGLSGCGKTHATDRLLQNDPAANTLRLRSDVERKRLFGLHCTTHSHSPLQGGIYAPDAHDRTYARLHELAEMLLRAGWSVVVDATFLKRANRAAFARLATELGVPFAILAPKASPAELRERILARQALGHDASEATLQVLEQQMQVLEPLAPHELFHF